MNRRICPLLFLIVINILSACAPELPNPAQVDSVTPIPTLDLTSRDSLCKAVSTQWGQDWLTTIRALEGLRDLGVVCDDRLAVENRLYTAYLGYGNLLEERGLGDQAANAYKSALSYNSGGAEAAERLQSFGVSVTKAPERCESSDVMTAFENLPDYKPTDGSFIRIEGQQFVLEGEPFFVYGANYYPRETPFFHFLTETSPNVVDAELNIIAKAGINTLRIFLRHDDLFMCPGNGGVPIVDNIKRLDHIIQIAGEKGFKLIVVLNQDPDLVQYPLYDVQEYTLNQITFLAERYRSEPAIMAWDVRDRGDLDYREGLVERDQVLTWLQVVTAALRQTDPNHLITAGWWEDSGVTAPLVDFVSFQHFGTFEDLRQNIAIYRDQTEKPILMIAVGYSTFRLDEIAQRNLLFQAFDEAEHNRLAGWMIYMAFDYPTTATCIEPDCPDETSEIHRYGIWNTSYFPKMALDAVERVTGVGEDVEQSE